VAEVWQSRPDSAAQPRYSNSPAWLRLLPRPTGRNLGGPSPNKKDDLGQGGAELLMIALQVECMVAAQLVADTPQSPSPWVLPRMGMEWV